MSYFFFFVLVKSYSISPVHLHALRKRLCACFFEVCVDHLFDNLEFGERNYCFGKSLEKVLNFGFKNLYGPWILLLKANSRSFCLSYPSHLSLTKQLWHDLCLVNMDLISAKELLVLAQTADEQKQWVLYLSKKIVRKEPKLKSASVRYVSSLAPQTMSFPDRNLCLSSLLNVWVLSAIFSSFAPILDVSILNFGCWAVFGFCVRLAILVDVAVARVTQAWTTCGAGRSFVFWSRWHGDACDSLYKD